jgi:phosphatidylinositol-bisphosphatase
MSNASRLRIGTFNVNGKTPTSSIRSWVCSTLEKSEDPDVLVFGFQELDLSAGALLYTTSTALEDTWTTAILEGLGAKAGSYVKVSLQLPALTYSLNQRSLRHGNWWAY